MEFVRLCGGHCELLKDYENSGVSNLLKIENVTIVQANKKPCVGLLAEVNVQLMKYLNVLQTDQLTFL